MNKQYKLFLYRFRYKGIEIPLYAPTEIERYFNDNEIKYARNMLYKSIDIDLKKVEKATNELAMKLYENNILKRRNKNNE